jgi:hypothetical protein
VRRNGCCGARLTTAAMTATNVRNAPDVFDDRSRHQSCAPAGAWRQSLGPEPPDKLGDPHAIWLNPPSRRQQQPQFEVSLLVCY